MPRDMDVPHEGGFSLIIPAYNEQEAILYSIPQACESLSPVGAYEIILVNDGSTDETGTVARELVEQLPTVRLIEHPTNLGYGAALRSGFREAKYPVLGFTDADGQFDLSELLTMIPLCKRYDIVAGFRHRRSDHRLRKLLSRGYRCLIGCLFGVWVEDCDCALKVFHRDVLRAILPRSADYFVNTELFWRAARHELRICEVAVNHRPRNHGHSKVSWRDIPRTLRTLIPFWIRYCVLPKLGWSPNPTNLPAREPS